MPLRPVAGGKHGQDRRRRQHIDDRCGNPPLAGVIAGRRPAQQFVATHRERPLLQRENRAIGQIVKFAPVAALFTPIETLGMQPPVHLLGTRPRAQLKGVLPAPGERLRVIAAALKTGAVAGRKRCHFIEEEQFGIAVAPNLAMAILEIEPAANPLP